MGYMSKAKSRTTKPILLSNMCNKKEHSCKINQKVNWKDYMKLWDLRKQQHKGTNCVKNLKN